MPATRRDRSASMASSTRSQGPRQPIWGSSSPSRQQRHQVGEVGSEVRADRERLDTRAARHVAQSARSRSWSAAARPCRRSSRARPGPAARGSRPAAVRRRCRSRSRPGPALRRARPTTWSAPSSARPSARAGLPTVAMTRAPAREASWTAKRPTPPDAPLISTVRPSTDPSPRIARSAVTAGHRQRRRLLEADLVGQNRQLAGVDRAQLRPRARPAERDHPRAGRGPRAVRGRGDHGPGGVPARHLAGLGVIGEERDLAEVQRDRRHPDERLGGSRLRIGGVAEAQAVGSGSIVDQSFHRA